MAKQINMSKITNSQGIGCNGDGVYVLNTNDVFLEQDQFENNGNQNLSVSTVTNNLTATVGSWSTGTKAVRGSYMEQDCVDEGTR